MNQNVCTFHQACLITMVTDTNLIPLNIDLFLHVLFVETPSWYGIKPFSSTILSGRGCQVLEYTVVLHVILKIHKPSDFTLLEVIF